jgi:transposase-like protein
LSPAFKREPALLVVDQNYTVPEATTSEGIGLSAMTTWVKQRRYERQDKTSNASPDNSGKNRNPRTEKKRYNVLKWKMEY